LPLFAGHSNYQSGPNQRYLLSKSGPFNNVDIKDRVRKIRCSVLYLALSVVLLFALCWHSGNKYMDGW